MTGCLASSRSRTLTAITTDPAPSASTWWFRGAGEDFSAWLEMVEGHGIWQRLAGKTVRDFVISADGTR